MMLTTRLSAALAACFGAVLVLPSHALAQTAPPGLRWAPIPAGTFQMGCVPADTRCDGDEQPRHAVTISRPFELMTTEVTAGMFRAVMKVIDEQPNWSLSPEHPVAIVTWDEAAAFCTAVGGRLPTEAEWEYAARGGRSDTVFPWGNQPPDDRAGAVNGATFETDSPQPAGTFAANGFGLVHMAGNVWEWVADFYGIFTPEAQTDPPGASGGGFRVVRGGSYGDDPANLRLSNRNPNRPGSANVNVGFRCARDLAR